MAGTQKSGMNTNQPPSDSEARFRSLFLECPVSLWEEDITDLTVHLDNLRSQGIKDFRSHLERHPEEVARCAGLIRTIAVNKATQDLYEAADEKSLLEGLSAVFTEESLASFREILVALAEGKKVFDIEAVNSTLRGKRLRVRLKGNLLPDAEDKRARALVAVVPVTERRKADDEQRASETRYRQLFETSRDGIAITDLSGRYLDCNRAYLDLLGYDTIDQLRLKSYKELTPPEYHAFEAEVVSQQTLVRGWCDEYEKEYIRRTGERVPVSLRAWLQRNAQGQPSGMWVIVRDITERKRADEEIRMLKHSIDTYYDGAYWMDSDNKFVYVNDAGCTALGYQREELIGKTVNEVNPRVNAERMKEVWARLRQGGSYSTESVHRRKDGCEFPVEVVITYVRFGGREYGCAFARDITERRKAADNLIHSHTLMQYIISHAQSSIAVHDRDLKYVYVSEQYLREYKVKEPDVIGKHHYEVFPDLPQKWRDVHQRVLAGAVESSEEDPYVREDGSVDWTRWECRPWYETDGSIGGLIVYTEVITKRKETEKLLQQQRAQLEEAQRISKVGSWERDISTNAVIWSDELMRIFGINTREQRPTFQMLLDMMHPDDRGPFQKAVKEAVFKKKPYSIEYRIIHGDGSIRFIHARGEAHYDDSGKPLIFRGTAQDITEHKQMEKALRESKERLDFLVSSSPAMIYTSKTEGEFGGTFVSENIRTLLGYEPRQFIEDTHFWADRIHPDDAPRVFAELPRLFEQGRHSYEYRFLRSDGFYCWMFDDMRLVQDALGKPVEIIGYWVDVTERKRVEEALLDSEMRYRSLFEQSGDGILVMKIGKDNIPIITDMNETALLTHGYAREEMVGRPISILDHVADIGVDDGKIKSLKNENVAIFTTQHRRKDGSLIDVEVRARLISIGGEQIIVSSERDVTERKRMEEALRKDEEFIRNILDTVDEAFIVIDRDYRIITANKAYCTTASHDDVIGKHCYEISHGRNIPCFDAGEECAVRTVFETGTPQVSVHTHQDEAGRLIYVETKAFPIKDSSGNVISAIETINNITEKHLLEEERLKTQKLEAIGTLAGGIAHDFNNLLQGVFGYISLAKLTLDQKEKSAAALEQAEKALHMTVNLTSQLLTFSKGGKPVKQRIDLRPVIENAARFALSGSRSDCLLDISEDLWAADADSGQIGQVIQNIVLNADQSMPEGGHVEITAYNVQAPDSDLPKALHNGQYVKISIKDNGVGIPEQYLAKIFDPYFTTKEKGSGLGLATSYSIVRNHGGLIDVQSLPGKGSTFIVYLPAAAMVPPTKAFAAVSRSERRGRILVMDDDEVIRLVAGEMIRALGHDVDFAEHGEAALAKHKAAREAGAPFDIVIMDLTVRGGMGGVETVQKMREIDPELKAVVSSGYSDNSRAAEYQKIGFRSFLKKPYNIEELRETLHALLI